MNPPDDGSLTGISSLTDAIAFAFGYLRGYSILACRIAFAGVVASRTMSLGGLLYGSWYRRRDLSTRGAKVLVSIGAIPVVVFTLLTGFILTR